MNDKTQEKSISGMLLDGIACSSAIDSSGESLDVSGCDIGDLEEGKGVFVYEHKDSKDDNSNGQEIVGKVIYAKKILEASDCENDRQKFFWDKIELPYVYIIGRLYDAAGHKPAQAIAAQVRDHVANNEPILIRYSVEGSTLERDGNKLKRSVIKRIAITLRPCNRTCDSGLLSDPQAPTGFDKKPVKETEDILAAIESKKHEDPANMVLGGSVETEYSPYESDDLVKSYIKLKVFAAIKKAMTAGSCDVAPSSLSGGAALQREDLGSHRQWKEKAMKAFREYDQKAVDFDKSEFRTFLKHSLPECDDSFIDRFVDIIDDYKIKIAKAEEQGDASFDFGANAPEKPKTARRELPPLLTVRGQKVKAPSGLRKISGSFSFDENKGELKTPRGSVKMYIPSQDPAGAESFHGLMKDPKVNEIHDRVMENWLKVNELARKKQTPPELTMHAALFSLLSPNTAVPVQELMYCLSADTILHTSTGEIKAIRDFGPGDTVCGVDNGGDVVYTKVVALHDHGLMNALEVTFDDGYCVCCSSNHKFLTEIGQVSVSEIIEKGLEIFCATEAESWRMAEPLRVDTCNPQTTGSPSGELSGLQRRMDEGQGGTCQAMAQTESSKISRINEVRNERVETLEGREPRFNYRWDSTLEGREPRCVQPKPNQGGECYAGVAGTASRFSQGPHQKTHIPCQGMETLTSRGVRGKLSTVGRVGKYMEGRTPRRVCCNFQKVCGVFCKSAFISNGRVSKVCTWGIPEWADKLWRTKEEGRLYKSGPQTVDRSGRILAFFPGQCKGDCGREVGLSAGKRQYAEPRGLNSQGCDIDQAVNAVLFFENKKDQRGVAGMAYSNAPLSKTGGLVLRRIVRVRAVGLRHMYDLEVSHPKHNFCLPNGVVTSNSHLADSMAENKVNAISPDFPALRQDWMDRDKPKVGPKTATSHFDNAKVMNTTYVSTDPTHFTPARDEFGNKIVSREPGDYPAYALATNKFARMAQYHKYHNLLHGFVRKHGGDARSAMTDIMANKGGPTFEGLAQKTGRYMLGMLGAGNVFVPDTHMIRYLFGLEHGADEPTIKYIKNGLWRPDQNTANVLAAMDRHYFRHHPAVQDMLQGKWGKYFKDDPEQAIFPAFWKNWANILPHERARGLKTEIADNEGTDHRPFWETVAPLIKSEATNSSLAYKTAMLHRRWAQQYGEVPAMMLYYAHLVPHLLRASESQQENPMIKAESLVINLSKALADAKDEVVSHGVAFGGGQRFEVIREEHDCYIARGEEGLVKLPKATEGKLWDLRSPPKPKPDLLVQAHVHGISGLCDTPEQQALVHGLELGGRSGWAETGEGSLFLRGDKMEHGWNSAKKEAAFYNAARDVWGLSEYLPMVAAFSDPDSGTDIAAISGIPLSEHVDAGDDLYQSIVQNLGNSGELAKLAIMDTVMGVERSDFNMRSTVHTEPYLRLVDHGDLHGLELNTGPRVPAYLTHYADGLGKLWQELPLPAPAREWAINIPVGVLESSLRASGMPHGQAAIASQRLWEIQEHLKKNGSNATMGSTIYSPWSRPEDEGLEDEE